jgi:acyl carrier protein
MTRDEIYDKVKDVLEEALGVDDDEIAPEASLTADLGAESIDVLDIQFRLEKAFSTPQKPFKVAQGELFPENLLENPDWVQSGRFTDAGMKMLRDRMPHVDFTKFDTTRQVEQVAEQITVDSLVDFVERKMARG